MARPTKTPVEILHFAESKNEPLSRKNSGKAAQNALGKGTGPSNLPDTAVGIFLSRLKKWAQKSPEAVETSGLFAAASIWVQLDGKRHPFRYHSIFLRYSENGFILRFCHDLVPQVGILAPRDIGIAVEDALLTGEYIMYLRAEREPQAFPHSRSCCFQVNLLYVRRGQPTPRWNNTDQGRTLLRRN